MSRCFWGVLSLLAVTACQEVHTTNGGAVGVRRDQYMFSLLSSDEVNSAYVQSYRATLTQAAQSGTLVQSGALVQRVNAVTQRLIAQVGVFRADATRWSWEVNVVSSKELNANCGPGGKIIFYTGLIETLNLSDDEIAAVMGHEIAHALREHGREAMSKAYGVQMASRMGTALGITEENRVLADTGVKYLMTLPNSRENESEADLIGLELAARAGYNPNAALSLWQKMTAVGGATQPEFMSTHPAPANRMAALSAAIPKVMPLYEQAQASRH